MLLKQTAPANAMLTRLSSFLRHTLVSEPGGMTVEQEVEMLKLYLDIERMWFEDRLQTDFRIEPGASEACIPSMLLQPLVERNQTRRIAEEEGATISLVAQIAAAAARNRHRHRAGHPPHRPPGRRYPGGIPDGMLERSRRTTSTGVGLANIRDRLAQAYGDDHRFEIRSPDSGGFTVMIEIPYEAAEDPAPSASKSTSTPQARQPIPPSSVSALPPEKASPA